MTNVDPQALLARARALVFVARNLEECRSTTAQFAAKSIPGLTDEQRQHRQQFLSIPAQMFESEFEKMMDELCKVWLQYKEASNA